jgi:hypothetical protein
MGEIEVETKRQEKTEPTVVAGTWGRDSGALRVRAQPK